MTKIDVKHGYIEVHGGDVYLYTTAYDGNAKEVAMWVAEEYEDESAFTAMAFAVTTAISHGMNEVINNQCEHWEWCNRCGENAEVFAYHQPWCHECLNEEFPLEKSNDQKLIDLWEEFGDVPINDNDEIDVDWHLWEKGTDRFEIWHWFDRNFEHGLVPTVMSWLIEETRKLNDE